jgi:trehalose 6-phosphate phosphatase
MLAKRHLARLAVFARANVLVAFDYDGTLAPISPNPERAPMRARTRRLLDAVAVRYPCVVISGRARSDLARWLAGVPVWHLSGNHGLEPWAENSTYPAQVREWDRRLHAALTPYRGVVIENKTYSITVHYRHAQPYKPAVDAVNRAVRTIRGARLIRGKESVSILPRDAVDKGEALQRARRLLHCDLAIYVGDDDTDEDAFEDRVPGRILGIRVGRRRESHAQYHLTDQHEIDALLQTLVRLRPIHEHRAH